MTSARWSPFWNLYEALPETIPRLADKQFARFEQDPFCPSLQFKELNAQRSVWSARIDDDYRVLGFREGPDMTWFWIGSHADYDRMLTRIR